MKRAVFVVLVTALLGTTAHAQPPPWAHRCAPTDQTHEKLRKTFAEHRHARAIVQTSGSTVTIIEIWFSRSKGTWTILETYPNGKSCFRGAGTDFMIVNEPEPKAGSAL